MPRPPKWCTRTQPDRELSGGCGQLKHRVSLFGQSRRVPIDTRMPFRRRDALAAGITDHALGSGRFRLLLRGVYVAHEVKVDGYIEARAALLASHRAAFVSHHTAARLYRAVVPHSHQLHLSVPRGTSRADRDDLVVHSSSRVPVVFRGQRVTTPEDTFLDMAAHLDLVDLVILGDSLVKGHRAAPAGLVRAAGSARGRGARRARRAAALVRRGVDSPMETRCRLLRVLSGLPELETDLRFHDEHGNLRRRLDAGDRATRTAVEYDGRHHVERQTQWEADLGRREEFEDDEWRIVTLVSKDVYKTPADTVARLERIFRRRGLKMGRPSQEWRRYFPGHG
jgi:very-short-patch-repair endonuclease